jgi:hypothetical protein
MEIFFSSLKTERTARKRYRTRDEAKADVFDYIERFYNAKRRHSTIGYLSPGCVRGTGGVSFGACLRDRQQPNWHYWGTALMVAKILSSGWFRLWLVVSLVWWAAGAWWVTHRDYNTSPIRDGMPPINWSDADYCPEVGCTPCAGGESNPFCKYLDGTLAARKEGYAEYWASWIDEEWRNGELPLALFGPFAIGALMMGAGWVRKGFQRSPSTPP